MPLTRLALAVLLAAAPMPHAARAATPAVQQGYVSAVLIGANDPAGILPTFDKVPGAGTDNLDVALPTSVLTRGQSYVVMVMSQVATFSGTCQTSFQLTQKNAGGATTVLSKGAVRAYACSSGQIFGYALGTRALGGTAGPATLSGIVSFGAEKVRLSVNVLLQ